jgi:hypothetical protein
MNWYTRKTEIIAIQILTNLLICPPAGKILIASIRIKSNETFALRTLMLPHPPRKLAFLDANRVEVDRGRVERRMAHPFLHKAGQHSFARSSNTEAVPETARASHRAMNSGAMHERADMPPSSLAAPWP